MTFDTAPDPGATRGTPKGGGFVWMVRSPIEWSVCMPLAMCNRRRKEKAAQGVARGGRELAADGMRSCRPFVASEFASGLRRIGRNAQP